MIHQARINSYVATLITILLVAGFAFALTASAERTLGVRQESMPHFAKRALSRFRSSSRARQC